MPDISNRQGEAFTTTTGIEVGALAEARRRQVRLSVIADGCVPSEGAGNAMVFLYARDARRLGWDLLRAARQIEGMALDDGQQTTTPEPPGSGRNRA